MIPKVAKAPIAGAPIQKHPSQPPEGLAGVGAKGQPIPCRPPGPRRPTSSSLDMEEQALLRPSSAVRRRGQRTRPREGSEPEALGIHREST